MSDKERKIPRFKSMRYKKDQELHLETDLELSTIFIESQAQRDYQKRKLRDHLRDIDRHIVILQNEYREKYMELMDLEEKDSKLQKVSQK